MRGRAPFVIRRCDSGKDGLIFVLCGGPLDHFMNISYGQDEPCFVQKFSTRARAAKVMRTIWTGPRSILRVLPESEMEYRREVAS